MQLRDLVDAVCSEKAECLLIQLIAKEATVQLLRENGQGMATAKSSGDTGTLDETNASTTTAPTTTLIANATPTAASVSVDDNNNCVNVDLIEFSQSWEIETIALEDDGAESDASDDTIIDEDQPPIAEQLEPGATIATISFHQKSGKVLIKGPYLDWFLQHEGTSLREMNCWRFTTYAIFGLCLHF